MSDLHDYNLEAFVAGELPEDENLAILNHLAECEACMARVDALWEAMPGGSAEFPIPDLDPQQARALERNLFKRIRRSDLTGETLRLMTSGFFGVVYAMIRPIFERNGNQNKGN